MQKLMEEIEKYGFECEAGPLTMCQQWIDLKRACADEVVTKGVTKDWHVCHECDGRGIHP